MFWMQGFRVYTALYWGNYKTGIVIVSPVKLRDNFLKIEKIINYHILKGRDVSKFSKECPLCGSKHILASNDDNFIIFFTIIRTFNQLKPSPSLQFFRQQVSIAHLFVILNKEMF